MKLFVPELVELVSAGEELAPDGEVAACGEFFGRVEAKAMAKGSAEASCVYVGVGDDPGVPVCADVGDAPDVVAKADADPPAPAVDAAADGFDPPAEHAVRAAPPMTAAMITAGTRDILMLLPSGEQRVVTESDNNVSNVTIGD